MFQNKNKLFSALSALVLTVFVFNTSTLPAQAANPLDGQETTVISRTNAIRSANGLGTLRTNSKLMASARAKAQDMATKGYFGHANPEGFRMAYWIKGQGYSYDLAGENLAKGFTSIDRLMNAWSASPTHYANLVEPKFQEIGVGIAEGTYEGKEMVFVVQHFGDPVGVPVSQPVVTPAPAPVVAEPAPVVSTPATVTQPSTQPVLTPEPRPFVSDLVIVPAAQAAETLPTTLATSTPVEKEEPTSLGILLMLIALAAVGHTIDEWTFERLTAMALACKNCVVSLHRRAQEALA